MGVQVIRVEPIHVRANRPNTTVPELIRMGRPTGTLSLGEKMLVDLPPGDVPAFTLGTVDKGSEVDCRFVGEGTIELRGHNTRIMPLNDDDWGATIYLNVLRDGRASWGGRVTLNSLEILCSGSNGIQTITAFGDIYSYTPYKEITLIDCSFRDHPNPAIQCVRPVSVNQGAISAFGCVWNMPRSKEHAIYSRNPYNATQRIERCRVVAVGGQCLQWVSRTFEGPTYGRSRVIVQDNDFRGYHRHASRAGSALTVSGSGQDWTIKDNVVMDLDPPDHGGGHTFGGMVSWDGGSYWPMESGKPNGNLTIAGNIFVQRNSNRPVVNIGACEEAIVQNNGISGRDVELHSSCGSLFWSDNNKKEHKAKAIDALGAQEEWLTNPPVKRDGVVIGRAHHRFSW